MIKTYGKHRQTPSSHNVFAVADSSDRGSSSFQRIEEVEKPLAK